MSEHEQAMGLDDVTSDPLVADMLAAYKEDEDIPADVKSRVQQRLTSAPPLSPAPAAGGVGRLLWGAVGAGIIIAAIFIVPRLDLGGRAASDEVVDEPVAQVHAPGPPGELAAPAVAKGVATMSETRPAEEPAEPADVDAEPGDAPSVAEGTAKSSKSDSKKSRRGAGGTDESPVEPAMSLTDSLAEETALLRRAQSALSGGNPGKALSVLREHERKFESGVLVEERRALMAIALCDDGQRERGQKASRVFANKHPGSALHERVRTACSEASP